MGPTSTILERLAADTACGAGEAPQRRTTTISRDADQPAARIATHMPMAARIARGFVGRGEELDDLIQVAMLALVKAAARFDPARDIDFAQYAHPCIMGGLKKHFRDNGWSLHISRRMQELHLQTSQAIPGLAQTLLRTPTITDLSVHLHLSEQDVRDGVNSGRAYTTRSLDAPAVNGADTELGQILGGLDARLESVADRHLLDGQLALLPSREQHILRLRFSHGLRQREIAEMLGISQMHVSRLITRSLAVLRVGILTHADKPRCPARHRPDNAHQTSGLRPASRAVSPPRRQPSPGTPVIVGRQAAPPRANPAHRVNHPDEVAQPASIVSLRKS